MHSRVDSGKRKPETMLDEWREGFKSGKFTRQVGYMIDTYSFLKQR